MSAPLAYDVAVVGGGPAGIAAALAATRGGATTLLVDRGPRLGGNVANAFVHTICGLYEPADAEPPRRLHVGLPEAVARSLAATGDAGEAERAGRVHVLPIRPRGFEQLALRCVESRASLALKLGWELVALHLADVGAALELCRGPERLALTAALVIDASGDGDAAALAGVETSCDASETLQNPSYIVRLRGVPASALAGFARMQLAAGVAQAARRGALPAGCDSVLLRPGGRDGQAHMTLNLPKPDEKHFDPLDPAQRRRLAEAADEHVRAIIAFLRREREGFAAAELDEAPSRIGVREGRRIVGRSVLDAAHVLEGRGHRDEVARGCWPIELWHGHQRARFEHVRSPCAVPLGALIAAKQPRLGMAGRCVSATHEALGSLRVIGTALATGEAIGIAASLAAEQGTDLSQVTPARVRETIAKHAGECLS